MSKSKIISMYEKDNNISNVEIASILNLSPQYVGKVLKGIRNNKNEEVIKSYFEIHRSITEISGEFNISAPTIRKILISYDKLKFHEEKQRRKIETANRAKEKNKQYKMSNVEKLEEARTMARLAELQRQCAIEDSRSSKLSTQQIVNLNLQHYKFNTKKNAYEFNDSTCELPSDMPKVFRVTAIYETGKIEQTKRVAEFFAK